MKIAPCLNISPLRGALGDLMQIEGPNRVGKTSLLRLLTGLSQPFAGEVCWNRGGHPPLPGRVPCQPALPGPSARGQGDPDPSRTSPSTRSCTAQPGRGGSVAGAGPGRPRRFRGLSRGPALGGAAATVALARLWLSDRPALWILDEPFTAIDKQGSGCWSSCF